MVVIDLDKTLDHLLEELSARNERAYDYSVHVAGGEVHLSVYSSSAKQDENGQMALDLDTNDADETAEFIGISSYGYFSWLYDTNSQTAWLVLFGEESDRDEWDRKKLNEWL